MAMRLYSRDDIVKYAQSCHLKAEEGTPDHLIFSDKNGDPYSVPCPQEGCPDYLFDIFDAKVKKTDSKIIGLNKKRFTITEK